MSSPGLSVAMAAAAILLNMEVSLACTAIAVGKDASASGHPMVAHSEDSGPMSNDVRLVRVPRKQWPQGSMRPLWLWNAGYPRLVSTESAAPDYQPFGDESPSVILGHIPQVSETWAYWDTDYGVQNEWGLSIGESTCTANTVGWPANVPYGYNRAGIEDLSKLALERCKTARCAAKTMGQIAFEQGFYSADSGLPTNPGYTGSSECLVLADATPGEAWIFNVMTGKNNASAIWAAQRIPDNHVAAVGNSFTIRKMNLSDSRNFLYSPKVWELAEEKGWWSSKDESSPDIFDFFSAYGYTPTGPDSDFWNNVLNYYSGRRMWRIFSLLSPEEGAKLDPNRGNLPLTQDPYPNSVLAPSHSITPRMVMDVYRDHYEGTPYDLTKGMAAGPFGNPNRNSAPLTINGKTFNGLWERAIAMFRTTWSFVLEAKPNGRSVTWFGWDAPHGTAYLPLFGAATEAAPESYHSRDGHMSQWSTKVAFWAFNMVNQFQDVNFQLINAQVLKRAHRVEKEATEAVALWDAEAGRAANDESAIALLTKRSNAFIDKTVEEWWAFAFDLIAHYNRYWVKHNESANGWELERYPEWWLRSPEVGYTSWRPEGPYHGVPKETPFAMLESQLRVSQESSQYSTLVWCLVVAASSGLTASIAHKIGLKRGKASMETGTHYVAYA
jgi:dipeptidase